MIRKVNQSGISLIRSSEGCKLEAYPDPASPLAREKAKPEAGRTKGWQQLSGAPWTIGYGSTGIDSYDVGAIAGKPGHKDSVTNVTKMTWMHLVQRY